MDESVAKELVGHAHSSTTDRFYNLIDHDQMKKELKKYLRIDELPFDYVKDRIDQMIAQIDKSKLSSH